MSQPHVLLLGGTAEARGLARHLARFPVELTVSLAGATQSPAGYAGTMRKGGFGGSAGLARWIKAQSVSLLIDATHPFAAAMSRNAAEASRLAECPLLRLARPAWEPEPGEQWQQHPTLEAAISALPAGARVFLATGSGSSDALATRPDLTMFLRSIEPVAALPEHVTPILARPPFSFEEECGVMQRHAITHMVVKNSGGAGRSKLLAAKALGVQVLMIERPPQPEVVETLYDMTAMLERITACLSLDSASTRTP